MDLLKVENVSKFYANHTALDDVSFTIPEGSIYGLLGPNGAGKTTLIRIINRITAPDKGIVYFNGRELQPEDIYAIGYLPEERGLYKKMKVGEQAIFFARLKGLSRREAVTQLQAWFKKFQIYDWWDKKVEELSKGMAQKVQFIITVLHRPKLLIFDEPFSGFDPINANMLKEEILQLQREGATVVFSTHNMSSVEEICDHITLINKSHNVLSGKVEDIKRSYGDNRYIIGYEGEVEKAITNLNNLNLNYVSIKDDLGNNLLKVSLAQGTTVPQLIAAINDNVVINSINRDLPTMNDIFIKTVEEYNSNIK